MNRIRGSGGDIFKGPLYQQGYGLGGSMRRFFKWIVPLVKKHAVPALTSGMKDIGATALSSFGDFAKEVASGRDASEAAHHHATNAVNQIKEQVEKKFEGRGIKRRAKPKKSKIIIKKHKKSYDDIFN
jgi:hypothetical protein